MVQASIFDTIQVRKTMPQLFQSEKEHWLDNARQTARDLLKYQEHITIEDVKRYSPLPTYLHQNTAGAVFTDEFLSVGFTKAKHTAAKGRWIQEWRLK